MWQGSEYAANMVRLYMQRLHIVLNMSEYGSMCLNNS